MKNLTGHTSWHKYNIWQTTKQNQGESPAILPEIDNAIEAYRAAVSYAIEHSTVKVTQFIMYHKTTIYITFLNSLS